MDWAEEPADDEAEADRIDPAVHRPDVSIDDLYQPAPRRPHRHWTRTDTRPSRRMDHRCCRLDQARMESNRHREHQSQRQ